MAHTSNLLLLRTARRRRIVYAHRALDGLAEYLSTQATLYEALAETLHDARWLAVAQALHAAVACLRPLQLQQSPP